MRLKLNTAGCMHRKCYKSYQYRLVVFNTFSLHHTMDDNEKSLTPSLWTVRMPPSEVVDYFVKVTTKDSAKARQEIKFESGLRYGDKKTNKVHIFGTDLPDDSPILIFFSGGYWQALSGSISSFPALSMVKRGIKVAVPDYTRAPGIRIGEIVTEAIEGTKLVLDYAKKKGSRSVYLSGHSAGSHLCAMVLSSSWFSNLPAQDKVLFGGVFHLCGVFDLMPILPTSISKPLEMTKAEAEDNSPLKSDNVNAAADNMKGMNTIAFYYGEHDAPALIIQGGEYKQALLSCPYSKIEEKKCFLKVAEGFDHFDLVEGLSEEKHFLVEEIADAILN